MMYIMVPTVVTTSNVVSSTAATSLYEAYSATKTYAQAAVVSREPLSYSNTSSAVVTYLNRDYESLQSGNLGKSPDANSTWWLDLGASNKMAMFDFYANVPTVATSPLVTQVTLVKRVNSVVLFGVEATSVTLVVTNSTGTVMFTQTVLTSQRYTTRAYEYAFGEFLSQRKFAFLDLPPITNGTYTLTVTNSGGSASIEAMCIGSATAIGEVPYGAEVDVLDFSTITRLPYGRLQLTPVKTIPKMSLEVIVKKQTLPALQRLKEENSAKPLVFLGLDDSTSQYFDPLLILGIFRRMPIVISYPVASLVRIDVESL